MINRGARYRSGDTVIGAIILASATLALGIAVWVVVAGWSGASTLSLIGEANKEIAQQRSLLIIEYVDKTAGKVWISNPGRTDLVIVSCVIYQKGSAPPSVTYREIKRVPADMTVPVYLQIGSDCEGEIGDNSIVEIYAIPAIIFNPRMTVENIQWGIRVVCDA